MKKLLAGIHKFQNEVYAPRRGFFQQLAQEIQHPRILFITCSDSRIDPMMMTQSDPGELFVIRNAGNLVPAYTGQTCGEAATIEYAVEVLKVADIVICGHTHCGATEYLMHSAPECVDPHLPMVSKWLRHASATRAIVGVQCNCTSDDSQLALAIETNVAVQLKHLETHPSVAKGLRANRLRLHGWVYEMDSGCLKILQDEKNGFESYNAGEANWFPDKD